PAEGARHGDGGCGGSSRPDPAAPHPDDVGSDDHGCAPRSDGTGRGVGVPTPARVCDRGWHLLLHGADPVRRPRGLPAARSPADRATATWSAGWPTRRGRLMLALLAALQLQLQVTASAPDSVPTVTLSEPLHRATGLDPAYVAAVGQVDNAVWARRSAFSVFILPAVTLSTDVARPNPAFFNFATLEPEQYSVQAQATL